MSMGSLDNGEPLAGIFVSKEIMVRKHLPGEAGFALVFLTLCETKGTGKQIGLQDNKSLFC